MIYRLVLCVVLLLSATGASRAQKGKKPVKNLHGVRSSAAVTELPQVLGIRPGLPLDSIERAMGLAGMPLREVSQDTLTNCFADQSIRIFIVDSIYCRFTWMRFSLLFDNASKRLRRFTITPRESAIRLGQDDDVDPILLLYFGQGWGKPEIELSKFSYFRWKSGNLETRGYIRRGYPLWVMEG